MPVWLSYPSRTDGGEKLSNARHCLFFFLPGNPGFVDYYETFLSTLRTLLDKVEDTSTANGNPVRFHILGRNLLGFDAGDNGDGQYGPAPFNLDTQIKAAADAVAAARIDSKGGPRDGEPFDEVILSGHSVGSYIALEVFRRHMENASTASSAAPPPAHLHLKAGILLFATLTHLAESPRGVGLSRLLKLPFVGANAATIADGFLWCWPTAALDWVVRNVLGFPPHAAAATTRFLSNGVGVHQAIFLGKDELVQIAEDKWGDEVWEVAEEAEDLAAQDPKGTADPPPKFVIYFGEDDHWVNSARRDQFIARREEHAKRDGPAHKKGRARIVMDEKGLPHAFCIKHGEEVAEKVSTWISSMLGDL